MKKSKILLVTSIVSMLGLMTENKKNIKGE